MATFGMVDKDLNSLNEQINFLYKKVEDVYSSKIREFLNNRLLVLGFTFKLESELFSFMEKRVRRIAYEGFPDYFEFYLDYKNPKDLGVFIGAYGFRESLDINDRIRSIYFINEKPGELK